MNRFSGIAIIALLISNCLTYGQASATVKNEEGNSLKVLSYNIWNGFDWGKDTDRQAKMIHWIKSKKPGVVALQELCGYTEEKLSEDAKQWGHKYSLLLKTDGYSVGLTSSKPIKLEEKVRDGLWHGMLQAQTWGIDFFVVHLSPADRDFRFKEAGIIRTKIQNTKNENYIVLGDFNAHSSFDGDQDLVDDNHVKRVRASDVKNKKHTNLLDGQFDYSVMSSFMALPLIDVIPRFVSAKERFTHPSKILIGTWQTKESVLRNRVRIDYILVSRALGIKSKNAFVFNEEDTDMLSDHYPIMAEFEWSDK